LTASQARNASTEDTANGTIERPITAACLINGGGPRRKYHRGVGQGFVVHPLEVVH
jgi:hypothetical protein